MKTHGPRALGDFDAIEYGISAMIGGSLAISCSHIYSYIHTYIYIYIYSYIYIFIYVYI